MTTNKTQDATVMVDRIREMNEQIIDMARRAGSGYLAVYERTLDSIAGYQQQLADATGVDWLQRLIEAQANFTREVGDLYASSARELLKR